MGRRRKQNSIASIRRKQAEGRGQGSLSSYKPAIYTYEIASRGKVARIKGATTNRVHHLLSQHEKYFLITLDYDPAVTDIREQYPLPLEDTLLIAAETGIRHPYADQCPAVMTTDFFYCRDGKWNAAAIKTSDDLNNKRTLDKLEIEKLYWERKRVPWELVTEKDISRCKASNLLWLHSGEPIEKLIPDPGFLQDLTEAFLEIYHDSTVPFSEAIETIESYCGLMPGTILQLFKHLIRKQLIPIDLSKPINLVEPRSQF